uniref:Uncharacterized protein n=1 Tax=Pseudonaja textilis TaxID=8673 RepID=A0A670Y914_PSETE
MPHFTVVPVEDQSRAGYDALEGLSLVDYSQPGADGAPRHFCPPPPPKGLDYSSHPLGDAGWVDSPNSWGSWSWEE